MREVLKRFDELGGKHAGFLRQILRADPIVGEYRFVGLAEEAADFSGKVLLRRVKLPAICELKILFCRCNVCAGVAFRCGKVLGGQLGRNLGRRRLWRRGFGSFRLVLDGGAAARAVSRAQAAERLGGPQGEAPLWSPQEGAGLAELASLLREAARLPREGPH